MVAVVAPVSSSPPLQASGETEGLASLTGQRFCPTPVAKMENAIARMAANAKNPNFSFTVKNLGQCFEKSVGVGDRRFQSCNRHLLNSRQNWMQPDDAPRSWFARANEPGLGRLRRKDAVASAFPAGFSAGRFRPRGRSRTARERRLSSDKPGKFREGEKNG
ncbi:MAG: hypothetical protein IJ783_05465 [Kiritimatiellae bacterium]|nr:hypothetical protein [Kiritimatiellia bacterium]